MSQIQALYSIPALASLLGVSTKTARRFLKRYEIIPIRIGNKSYVPLTSLTAIDDELYRSLLIVLQSKQGQTRSK